MGYSLSTQAESLDQIAVARGVLALEVIQQLAALVYHADQTAAGVVVMLVRLEVPLQLLNIRGQQCYLYFRGTGVAFTYLVLFYDLCFRSAFKAMLISSYVNLPRVAYLPFVNKKSLSVQIYRQVRVTLR